MEHIMQVVIDGASAYVSISGCYRWCFCMCICQRIVGDKIPTYFLEAVHGTMH